MMRNYIKRLIKKSLDTVAISFHYRDFASMVESFTFLKGKIEMQNEYLSAVRSDCRKNYSEIEEIKKQLKKIQEREAVPHKSNTYGRRFVDKHRSEFLPGEVVWGVKNSRAVELVVTGVGESFTGNKKHIYNLEMKSGDGGNLMADENEIFRTKEELIRKISEDGE